MTIHDYTLYSIIHRNAMVLRDRTALVMGDQRLNFSEFRDRVDRLSAGLATMGVGKGDRVAVVSLNNLEYMYLYGAAARIGAVVTPINWRLSIEEIEFMIQDSAPKVLIVESELQKEMNLIGGRFGFIEGGFVIGQSTEFPPFSNLFNSDAPVPETDVQSDDDFVIIYTAAVDVRPRGAVLSHRNILAANTQYQYFWGLTPNDVHLTMLPLFHILSLSMTTAVMQAGGTNVILPKFDTVPVLQSMNKERVTLFGNFPPILERLAEEIEQGSHDLSALRIVGGLDTPDNITRFQKITKARFHTGFGQAETTGLVTVGPVDDRPGAAGRLGYAAEVAVMDDHGRLVDLGESGEIVVRGPMVFKGYRNLPTDNEFTFRDGWHHTGDLGRIDEDGFLWYMGRTPQKELIKPGGENVYPAEVERAILEHEAVCEVAVIGVPDAQWGEAIKAVCVLNPGASLSSEELTEFVAQKIARYKKPKFVDFVESLPKTEGGQIDRTAVKAEYGGL